MGGKGICMRSCISVRVGSGVGAIEASGCLNSGKEVVRFNFGFFDVVCPLFAIESFSLVVIRGVSANVPICR